MKDKEQGSLSNRKEGYSKDEASLTKTQGPDAKENLLRLMLDRLLFEKEDYQVKMGPLEKLQASFSKTREQLNKKLDEAFLQIYNGNFWDSRHTIRLLEDFADWFE